MTPARRPCPDCGSVATARVASGWVCGRCGSTAREFPKAHAERNRGPDALAGIRDFVAGGYQRRRTPLD